MDKAKEKKEKMKYEKPQIKKHGGAEASLHSDSPKYDYSDYTRSLLCLWSPSSCPPADAI